MCVRAHASLSTIASYVFKEDGVYNGRPAEAESKHN
jgi:hypothetical protein